MTTYKRTFSITVPPALFNVLREALIVVNAASSGYYLAQGRGADVVWNLCLLSASLFILRRQELGR